MSVRIDWQTIKTYGGGLINSPYVFVLPVSYRNVILAISHILEWRATWRTNGYDYEDWDELQAIVAAGESGLISGVAMTDIIDALNDIRDAITAAAYDDTALTAGLSAIETAVYSLYCCDNPSISQPDPVDETTIGENEETYELPSSYQNEAEYLCAAGLAYAANLERKLLELDQIKTSPLFIPGTILAVVTSILLSSGVAIGYAIAAGIALSATSEIIRSLLDFGEGIFVTLANVAHDYAGCFGAAFVSGDGAAGKKEAILDNLASAGVSAGLVSLLDIGLIFEKEIQIYSYGVGGDRVDVTDYLGIDCNCIPACNDYTWNKTFDVTFPTSAVPVVDGASVTWDYGGRSEGWNSEDEAAVLNQGGGGYPPTRLYADCVGIYEKHGACCSVLAKANWPANPEGTIGLMWYQADGDSSSVPVDLSQGDYQWYNLPPSENVTNGRYLTLESAAGTTTQTKQILIKRIVMRYEDVEAPK